MMRNRFIILIFALLVSFPSKAQFSGTGSLGQVGPPGSNIQQNTQKNEEEEDEGTPRPPAYTLKRYFKSLAGKDSMDITRMWAGSIILPGTAQIYNKDYWKLPVLYGGMATFIYSGYKSNLKYQETGDEKFKKNRDILYLGAALTYWGAMVDGVASFKYYKNILPARASLYSALLPGLGQAYTGNYWKIPIFYGGFIACGYFIYSNNMQYQRYRTLYNEASLPGSTVTGRYNVETLKYFKDNYRRYRDYSVLAGVLVYALNIIDANVFAHLQDFDVSDDLSASFGPGIIQPLNYQFTNNLNPAFGIQMKLNF
ncbi:MAG: DUF5683 domain-containing protein [Rikenellaceae bacterium]